MIAPMQKVTVLCLDTDRQAALETLRDLGAVHLAPLQPPAGESLEALQRQVADVDKALLALTTAAAVKGPAPVAVAAALPQGGAPALVARVLELLKQRAALETREAELEKEREGLLRFGDFDPATVRSLAERGVRVRLYEAATQRDLTAPAGATLQVLHETKAGVAFVVVGDGEVAGSGVRELPLPPRRLSAVEQALAAARQERTEAEQALRALVPAAPVLHRQAAETRDAVRFEEARTGMGRDRRIVYLQGFCPTDAVPRLQAAADRLGWGVLAVEPDASETVPTLLRAPAWARPVMPIFEMLGILPGYREMDVSGVFLLFFSIFFAILIGDAGYGLIFLGLTALLKFKWKQAPAHLVPLLAILSVSTIVWGMLTGSYFGIQNLPAPLRQLKVDWLANEANIEGFCFALGAVHLTIAHGWNLLRCWKTPQALAQFGWIGMSWTMYFVACFLVLNRPAPGFTLPLFVASTVLVALFMTPPRAFKAEWSNHVMLPLNIIANFGDIVSYLRLYLVGSASVTLILAFNEMAIGKGITSIGAGIAAALIIFAAHTLNILLGGLAVLVHGVRLNALEFSTHLGIQWAGVKYTPFARTARQQGE